jgi:hypothetical protein
LISISGLDFFPSRIVARRNGGPRSEVHGQTGIFSATTPWFDNTCDEI